MYTSLGVVEVLPSIARLSLNSPLAGIARRKFAGKPLLEWVVRRVTEAHCLDRVVVLAGNDPLSRSLAKLVPRDVPVFISDAADPLERLASVVRQYPCYSLVRMSVSNPFVDPQLVDRLVTTALADRLCDYASFRFSSGRSAMQSNVGVFAEWCKAEAVLRAERLAHTGEDRETATGFLGSRPDLFNLKYLPVPEKLDRDDVRLEIQDEEDWEHVETILDALGPESLDWQFITSLLDRHPNICGRMKELNQMS